MRLQVTLRKSEDRFKADIASQEPFSPKMHPVVAIERERDLSMYDGDYEVNPDCDGRILPTKDKKMKDDVTVKPIQSYEVSNAFGGETLYIGSDVEWQ